ncbi:MAG: hypothetical protein KGJ34_02565 [Patescibacteria group bacterium]|nr:hypothetical protein [Patescibacteria group bacterium]
MLLRTLKQWIPLAIAVTGLCLLVYTSVQQNYRQSLNDPQIQMAEDAAAMLEEGASVSSVVPQGTVDIAQSLAPWISVYTASGTPAASSGLLGGSLPLFPQGVFDTSSWGALIIGHHLNAAPENENRFSWQPQDNVREAVVLVYYSSSKGSGYVAAGRNMREVEDRESTLSQLVFLAWIAILAATFLAYFFLDWVLSSTH